MYSVSSGRGRAWQSWKNLELVYFTQALYDARELAMTRMQHEAIALSATGIVGVQLQEHQHGWGGRAIEFLAIGTAITRDADHKPADDLAAPVPVIDLSDRARQEM